MLSWRLAEPGDIDALRLLMDRAIGMLLPAFLTPQQVRASYELMGLDTQLIADRTYFVVEADGGVAGCGGWSRRATLFGGDHTPGRDATPVDPATEPARVRAMYTDPDHVRRGVGRLILRLCEDAAGAEGFRRAEMAATLAGEPLYTACGYRIVEPFDGITRTGERVPLLRMAKDL